MGGALEDKSPHDFSISLGWLGGYRGVSDIRDVTVKGIENLCIADQAVLTGTRSFLSMENHVISSFDTIPIAADRFHRKLYPADALTGVDCTWVVSRRQIPAKYLFSWVGITGLVLEKDFTDQWNSGCDLDLPVGSTFDSKFLQEFNCSCKCSIRELRIGIVECSGRKGKQWIVCNFLAKHVYPDLYRFAKVYQDRKLVHTIYVDKPPQPGTSIKVENLTDVFKTLIARVQGKTAAEHIGREATVITHDLMLRCQETLRRMTREEIAKRATAEQWWEAAYAASLSLFETKIQKFQLVGP